MKKRAGVGLCLGLIMLFSISASFAALQYVETYTSPTGINKIIVLVNSSIYDSLYSPSLKQYIADLEAENYNVTLTKYISGSPQELKGYIKLFPNLKGAILIGDLPIPMYESANPMGLGYAAWPVDAFYTDLDGEWLDTDNNGIYDTHNPGSGSLEPEIWLGRLTASPIYDETMDEVGLLKNYFAKNHAYRTGNLSILQRALVYLDDDFAALGKGNIDSAYSNVTLITNGCTTAGKDYENRLTDNYEWIFLMAHSNEWRHVFYGCDPTGLTNPDVTYSDIKTIDPKTLFYTLWACSNCRYTAPDYMGGHYIFTKNFGLAAIGFTDTDGFTTDVFYPGLGVNSRENLGESLKNWIKGFALYDESTAISTYILTLLGDPTLTLDPPIAKIDSIIPSQSVQGQKVTFNGSGKITSGNITGYSWRSNKDGFLSNNNSFSTSLLSAGTHTIYFKVQDDKSRWSSEDKSIITVNKDTTVPTTPTVTDGGTYTSSATTLTARWTSSDLESGISKYQYQITQDSTTGTVIRNWTSTGTTPSVTATGLALLQGKIYYFGVKAKNGVGLWSQVGYSNGIKVDITAPSKPTVTDEGAYTNSTNTLKATWTSCSDLESGILAYQYKITQDSVTGTIITNWTSAGTALSVTASGLTLTQGKTYYFSVRSRNGAGLFSTIGYSDGIKVNTPPTAPIITSTDSGYVNISYNFTAQSTDADGDPIHLSFAFLGTDGLEHLVAIWYNNPATQSYSWNKAGTYYIKVLAEDDKGGASTWTKKNVVIR